MEAHFESNLGPLRKELADKYRKTLHTMGNFILTEVALRAPVGQYSDGRVGGNLRASYTDRYDYDRLTADIGSPCEYAPYVEFGTGIHAESGQGRKTPWAYQDLNGNWYWTRGSRPRRHLRPAFTENLEKLKELGTREFRNDK